MQEAVSQRLASVLRALTTLDSPCEPAPSYRKTASFTDETYQAKKNPREAGCKRESGQLLIHPGTGNEPNGTDDHSKK